MTGRALPSDYTRLSHVFDPIDVAGHQHPTQLPSPRDIPCFICQSLISSPANYNLQR